MWLQNAIVAIPANVEREGERDVDFIWDFQRSESLKLINYMIFKIARWSGIFIADSVNRTEDKNKNNWMD